MEPLSGSTIENMPDIQLSELQTIYKNMVSLGLPSRIIASHDSQYPGYTAIMRIPFIHIVLNLNQPPLTVTPERVNKTLRWWNPADQPLPYGLTSSVVIPDAFPHLPDTKSARYAILRYRTVTGLSMLKARLLEIFERSGHLVGYGLEISTPDNKLLFTLGYSHLPVFAHYFSQKLFFPDKDAVRCLADQSLETVLDIITKPKDAELDLKPGTTLYLRHPARYPCMETEFTLINIVNILGKAILAVGHSEYRTKAGTFRLFPLSPEQMTRHFDLKMPHETRRSEIEPFQPSDRSQFNKYRTGNRISIRYKRHRLFSSEHFTIIAFGNIGSTVYFKLEDNLLYDSSGHPRTWLISYHTIQKDFVYNVH